MKKSEYRLQTVLEARNRAREEAAKEVTVCLERLEQAELELNRRQNNLDLCLEKQKMANNKLTEELNNGLSTSLILQHKNFLDDLRKLEIGLKSELEKQKEVVENAGIELEKSRRKLLESSTELKSIEKHKSNWEFAENIVKNKQEQKISDEIGAILHSQKKNKQ